MMAGRVSRSLSNVMSRAFGTGRMTGLAAKDPSSSSKAPAGGKTQTPKQPPASGQKPAGQKDTPASGQKPTGQKDTPASGQKPAAGGAHKGKK